MDTPLWELGYKSILQKNQFSYGHDLKFAAYSKKIIRHKELSSLFNKVLDPVKFQNFLKLAYK